MFSSIYEPRNAHGMNAPAQTRPRWDIWKCCNGRTQMVVLGMKAPVVLPLRVDIWIFCNGRTQMVVLGTHPPLVQLGHMDSNTYCNGPFKMDARSKVNIESIGVLKSDSSLLCSFSVSSVSWSLIPIRD
jgi:hypothetical protein